MNSEEGIVVSKKDQFTFRQIEDYREGKISRKRAAELLGISERSVTRLAGKIRKHGLIGLKHGNYKKPPKNKIENQLVQQIVALKTEKYFDFNVEHFKEMLKIHHGIDASYTSLRRWCEQACIPKKIKHRRPSKKRLLRERMANEGLLLQMDGSTHAWNGKDKWCLIGMIDDATSKIPHAQFFDVENAANCLTVLRRIVEKMNGVPVSIYVDQASWFGGPKGSPESPFIRACEDLGIQVIHARSPEAKGRIERTWKTFQDRLIPELRLHGISSMMEANFYLQNTFLRSYWPRNEVLPESADKRYKPIPYEYEDDLDNVFCLKQDRHVRRDNTIFYRNKLFRVSDDVGSLAGQVITIHEYPDETIAAYQGGVKLNLTVVKTPGRSWRWGA